MRIMGIDYGEKRIGIAMSDPLGMIAQGVDVLNKNDSFDQDILELEKIIGRYEGVEEVVVGMPRNMRGEMGPQADKTQKFIDALQKELKLKITPWDERMTTVIAERAMISAGLSRKKRKKNIDRSAASLILQSYLDSKRR